MEITYEEFERVVKSSLTMSQAARSLGLKFSTFKRMAKKYSLYNPNPGRKGIPRSEYEDESIRIPLEKILNGDYPHYSRSKL